MNDMLQQKYHQSRSQKIWVLLSTSVITKLFDLNSLEINFMIYKRAGLASITVTLAFTFLWIGEIVYWNKKWIQLTKKVQTNHKISTYNQHDEKVVKTDMKIR